MSDPQLQNLSTKLRKTVLLMTHQAKSSHIGTNYSMIELLVVLYSRILRIKPDQPDWPNRDRFILSKGHGCAALYAILAKVGFFPVEWLDTFYQNGSRLAGHATHTDVPGIEISTGSLGHGLSIATGMALAAKRDDKSYRVFCLLSDGECDEGSTWEPILFAPQHKLDNLIAIIDYNKIQALGTVKEVIDLDPFTEKWQAFGWAVREINGHNLDEIEATLSRVPFEFNKPSCIIAHTVKGKGVSFMEDKLLWHYRSPQDEEFEAALAELESSI
jgi:transketolase